MNMFSKVFGSRSQREVKRIMPLVKKIEDLRPEMQKLTDEELRGKTREYKKRLEEGATLDDLLPEAFATVREAAKRVLGMEHFEVQLIGGIVLHQGRIAEMKTGEGKTLVATLPSYLNALEGKGVHVVTVNDYLAKRDAEEMGQVHRFLGLTVGVVLNDMNTFSFQCIQICRRCGNKCLTFTGLHLCDTSLMKNDTTDELYPVMLHAKHTFCSFTDSCKSFRKRIIQSFSFCKSFFIFF